MLAGLGISNQVISLVIVVVDLYDMRCFMSDFCCQQLRKKFTAIGVKRWCKMKFPDRQQFVFLTFRYVKWGALDTEND